MTSALFDPMKIAAEAALAAGAIQRERFEKPMRVDKKGAVDLVTEVDLLCETCIRGILNEKAPGQAVLGEEGGRTGSAGPLWIVDPLDGTTNYAHGIPVFCVSVAYEENGRLAAGAVYDPMRDELFTARAGLGAFLNGRPLSVSKRDELDNCLMATGFAYDYRTARRHNFDAFVHMTKITRGVRRLGAAALDLAYVAAGRFDGFWELGLKPWDTSAAALMVWEAGGSVTDLNGGPYDHMTPDIVATNGRIHGEVLKALALALPP